MENMRNRIYMKLVTNKKNYSKWTSKPGDMPHKIFDNYLFVICKSKVTLTFSKPVYVGICILDFIKVLMYKFHYDCIKNKYDNNSRLLFTGTDSLMYELKTEDVYEDFSEDKEMFNFSNYSAE